MARHLGPIASFVLAFGVLATASVASGQDSRPGAPQSEKCVRLVGLNGGEQLANVCRDCREVTVERIRPSGAFPATRTIIVAQNSRQDLPFRGPGRTRITGERSCAKAASDRTALSAATARACVMFGLTDSGASVLANSCPVCRTVTVERVASSGNRGIKTYALAPRSSLAFPTEGAAEARIVNEVPCG